MGMEDYLEIIVIFGHLTLFSVCFPIVYLLATAHLLWEMRIDGLKIFTLVQRPIPRNVVNIGQWQITLQLITWISVLSNSLLITYGFGAKAFDIDSDARWTLWFAVVLVLVAFKAGIMIIIPDVPDHLGVIEAHHRHVCASFFTLDKSIEPRAVRATDLDISVGDATVGSMRDPRDFGYYVIGSDIT